MKQYIFLLRVDPLSLTQEQVIALGGQWKKLIVGWSAEGIFIALYRFNIPGVHILGKAADVIAEKYFYENDVVLTGCMILLAKDIQEATEISRSFPTLSIGGNIEIRELQTNIIIE